jgi:predicted transposase YbfD/YdcC
LPKKTTAIIIEQQCDYVIGLKNNQPNLYKKVEQTMAESKNYSSWYITMDKNKGRAEVRKVSVSDKVEGIDVGWVGLKQLIKVERIVKGKKRNSTEQAYYISSKNSNALEYMKGIREHWAIENGLHYVKDVTQREDSSKICSGESPQNMSTIRNISLNIMRLNEYENIASATRLLANDIEKLKKIII